VSGDGQLDLDGVEYAVGQGEVLLLPEVVDGSVFHPGSTVNMLEISLSEGT
jgi:mannose-6-phosphate isomerase-like protein (cupin superfamily)